MADGAVFVGTAGVFSTGTVACAVAFEGTGVGCTSVIVGGGGSGGAPVGVATVGSVVAVPSSGPGVIVSVGESGVTAVGGSVVGVVVAVAVSAPSSLSL